MSMRRVTANYVLTTEGFTKDTVIELSDSGLITSLEIGVKNIDSIASLEQYNGLIVAGFINPICEIESAFRLSSREIKTPEEKMDVSRAWDNKLKLDGTVAAIDSSSSEFIQQLGATKVVYIQTTDRDSAFGLENLSIVDQLRSLCREKTLLEALEEVTIKAAKLSAINHWAGSIETGKSPSLTLIEGLDLSRFTITDNTKTRKL